MQLFAHIQASVFFVVACITVAQRNSVKPLAGMLEASPVVIRDTNNTEPLINLFHPAKAVVKNSTGYLELNSRLNKMNLHHSFTDYVQELMVHMHLNVTVL